MRPTRATDYLPLGLTPVGSGIPTLSVPTWRFTSEIVWPVGGSSLIESLRRWASDALLAPEQGVVLAVAGAPGGRYEVPSRADCRACHDSAAVPVPGFGTTETWRVAEFEGVPEAETVSRTV